MLVGANPDVVEKSIAKVRAWQERLAGGSDEENIPPAPAQSTPGNHDLLSFPCPPITLCPFSVFN